MSVSRSGRLMNPMSREKAQPLISTHGEVVYELIGRTVAEPTERHSLAYVVIPPGKSSLLHWHPIAEESYYVLRGTGRFVLADEERILLPGEAVVIPPTKSHQISNSGDTDLEFLAVCVPAWEPANSVYPDTESNPR
jgi:mannose-6-phosphate isomerase-like protein (cupin superfamily)